VCLLSGTRFIQTGALNRSQNQQPSSKNGERRQIARKAAKRGRQSADNNVSNVSGNRNTKGDRHGSRRISSPNASLISLSGSHCAANGENRFDGFLSRTARASRVVELADRKSANRGFTQRQGKKECGICRTSRTRRPSLLGRRRVQRKDHRSGSIPWPGACGAGQCHSALPNSLNCLCEALALEVLLLVPLKAHAFGLDAKFAANPRTPFSVEDEIRTWRRDCLVLKPKKELLDKSGNSEDKVSTAFLPKSIQE